MIKLETTNVLCFSGQNTFDIPAGVTLLCGKNSAGKTSLITIMQALCTMTVDPLSMGAGVESRKHYVTDGFYDGEACLTTDDGTVVWHPERGVVDSSYTEKLPSNKYSMGMLDFLKQGRGISDRQKFWGELFLVDDARSLLEPAMTEMNFSQSIIDQVVAHIEASMGSWEMASNVYQDQKRNLKKKWSAVTREQHGDKKALGWTPPGDFTPSLDDTEDGLQKEIELTQQEIRQSGKVQAVEEHIIEEAKEAQAQLPSLKRNLAKVKTSLNDSNDTLEKSKTHVNEEHDKLLDISRKLEKVKGLLNYKAPHRCPDCGIGLILVENKLSKFETITPLESESRTKERGDLIKARVSQEINLQAEKDNTTSLQAKHNSLSYLYNHDLASYNLLVEKAQDAQKKAVVAPSVDHLHDRLAELSNKKESLRSSRLAKDINDEIVERDLIIKILGPSGPKNIALAKSIKKMRSNIDRINEISEWSKSIHLSNELIITSGGRPLARTASNEKLKAQYALQFAAGLLRKSSVVCIDSADTLKGDSWNGLIKFMNRVKEVAPYMHVIVAATAQKEDVPDGWNSILLED